jgi:proteasome accessory factor A
MGIETEYGILSAEDPTADPQLLSAAVIGDIGVCGDASDPWAVTSRWLSNGARWYVDHAHPEYSTPEVTGPRDAVAYDLAGERLMAERAAAMGISLYKNNVDGKGSSYGTHENYQVSRLVPWEDLVTALVPFLVTRQVFAGAGRVGLGARGQEPGFQISQRADYIETVTGLATTARRSIVNTRDEPLCDPDTWRRVHLILGDANSFPCASWLKMGTTAMVLWWLESARDKNSVPSALDLGRRLALADPVAAVSEVSRDLTGNARLVLASGETMTALEIQTAYLDGITAALSSSILNQGDRSTSESGTCDLGTPESDTVPSEARAILAQWSDVLRRLGVGPHLCARDVEWAAKLHLIEAMRTRDRLGWDHPKLAAMDLHWSDVNPERGVAQRLRQRGLVDNPVSHEDVARAMAEPPADTRAFGRGRLVAAHQDARAGSNPTGQTPTGQTSTAQAHAVRILSMDWDHAVVADKSGIPARHAFDVT